MIIYDGDNEGEYCRKCYKLYHEVYEVSDKLWKKVTGWKNGEGLLCIECFTKIAFGKGIAIFWKGKEDSDEKYKDNKS